MELFPYLHFRSVCITRSKVGLLEIAYICYFCICSASVCLLVGAFSPLTFKVIIATYVLMGIFLVLFNLFLQVFFSSLPFFFSPLVVLWLFRLLFLFYVSIVFFLVYSSHEGFDIAFQIYIYVHFSCPAFVLASHSCWFWYHLWVWMMSYSYCMLPFTSELSHLWFSYF